MKKTGHVAFMATLTAVSGLRIGGSDDMLQIGGADITAVKHPVTRQPYIPGSSIKGKIRSEMERQLGKFGGRDGNEPCGCKMPTCLICRIFGPHKTQTHELGPTRIIVRDARPIGVVVLENKTSTMIDRRTGTAAGGSLRTEERVAAGSEFGLEIGIQFFDIDGDVTYKHAKKTGEIVSCTGHEALQTFVLDGLELLVRTGLGAGVGKGSGQISLSNLRRRQYAEPFSSIESWKDVSDGGGT